MASTVDTPPDHSPRVCVSCRVGKRKCDKLLPTCSRCSRLLMQCRYDPEEAPLDDHTANLIRTMASRCESSISLLRTMHTSIYHDARSNLAFVDTYFSTIHK